MRLWAHVASAVGVLSLAGAGSGGAQQALPRFWVKGGENRSGPVLQLRFDRLAAGETGATGITVHVPPDHTVDLAAPIGTQMGEGWASGRRAYAAGDWLVEDMSRLPDGCRTPDGLAAWRLARRTHLHEGSQMQLVVRPPSVSGSSYRLTICLPAGPPVGFVGIFTAGAILPPSRPPRRVVWRAVIERANGRPVEARSMATYPPRLTLAIKRFSKVVRVRKRSVRRAFVEVRGRVTEDGHGVGGAYVSLGRGPGPERIYYLAYKITDADGVFTVRARDRHGPLYQAVTIGDWWTGPRRAEPSACAKPWLAQGGCTATRWVFEAESAIVRAPGD